MSSEASPCRVVAESSAPGHSAWQARAGSAEMPLFPLNTVLFPGGPLPLRIFEPRYVDMVRACMRDGAPFGVVMIKAGQGSRCGCRLEHGSDRHRCAHHRLRSATLMACWVSSAKALQKIRVDERRVAADGLNVGTITWLPVDAAAPVP